MNVFIVTLGCKVNRYESQYLRDALHANGHHDNPDIPPELIIVNTCSVTAASDAKCRKLIASLARQYPDCPIDVIGCYAGSHPEKVAALNRVRNVLTDKRCLDSYLLSLGCKTIPRRISSFNERHRAYVKIQDGCLVGCTYCIIPKVRPYLSSRPIAEILDEAELLITNGFREIVLTGIHLGHYGLETTDEAIGTGRIHRIQTTDPTGNEQPVTLGRLLAEIAQRRLPGRFRLGSLDVVEVTDSLLDAIASNRNSFCPHFHLSMQSGDNGVLARMGRRGSCESFIDKCRAIRQILPGVAITTDIIVGFPGETEEEFERTCEVAQELQFAKIHLFRFSKRPGTVAATLPHQVPESVKKERAEKLEAIANNLRNRFAASFIGKKVELLVEEIESDSTQTTIKGTTEHYLTGKLILPASPSVVAVASGTVFPCLVVAQQEERLLLQPY